MPYPDRLLDDDEDVVVHLHPHASALVRPVACLFLVVGAGSFTAAAVPAGALQGPLRLGLLGLALVLGAVLVVRPLARWGATHYVLTTSRVLVRRGVVSRRGRELPLSRVTEVSYRQTLGQRLLRSGTVAVAAVGEGAPVLLQRVPRCQEVVALLHELVRDDEAWSPGEDRYDTGVLPADVPADLPTAVVPARWGRSG